MRALKVVPGGERASSPTQRTCAPGLRVRSAQGRPSKVRRRPARFIHAIDFGYAGFVLAWAATLAVLLHVAWVRAL